ncbi:MAG: hypothetical protein B7Z66_10450 [Chromatiales bacterium 21-64-14]|nr:MAG: hypothetical protein B7Z66_10450 [Chromatiales bacterium 21-64-14]
MQDQCKGDPFALLVDIERRSRANAAGLPRQTEVKGVWVGIGFRLGAIHLLAPLGEVSEILTYPDLARVPMAKPWVRGIANVRGNLLPIMDLQGYLGGPLMPLGRSSRVLVVQYQGVFAGLLVDEVLGLKHFLKEEQSSALPEVEAALRPYLSYAFRKEEEHWVVFSMYSLAETPQFLQVAV